MMWQVYFENRLINFRLLPDGEFPNDGHLVCYRQEITIDWVLGLVQQTPENSIITLYANDLFSLRQKFELLFIKKVVAGGLVQNAVGEYLFIHKNGHWDLPKGHLEPNETLIEAAKREVKEETGIGDLEIANPLSTTNHFFQEKGGEWILKETYWFLMKTTSCHQPIIDRLEGISGAKWVGKNDLDNVLENAYASIRQVVSSIV